MPLLLVCRSRRSKQGTQPPREPSEHSHHRGRVYVRGQHVHLRPRPFPAHSHLSRPLFHPSLASTSQPLQPPASCSEPASNACQPQQRHEIHLPLTNLPRNLLLALFSPMDGPAYLLHLYARCSAHLRRLCSIRCHQAHLSTM